MNKKEKIEVIIFFIPELILAIFTAIVEAIKDTFHWAKIYFYHLYQ